jgi:surface antigen
MRRPRSTAIALLALVALSACAQPGRQSGKASGDANLECVSYARQLTGIQISGDAWTWWHGAGVRYKRSNKPSPMSVLVLRRTGQLPGGHVAVVRSVVSSREIRVDHANWDDRWTRGRIYEDMSVIDVSPRNDWTTLRFWNGASYGKTYAAYGFIESRPVPTDTTIQASR